MEGNKVTEAMFYNMKTGEELLRLDSVEFNTGVEYNIDAPKMPVDLRLQGTFQIENAEINVDWLTNTVSMFVTDEKEYRRLCNKLVKCKNERKYKKLQKQILKLFNTL